MFNQTYKRTTLPGVNGGVWGWGLGLDRKVHYFVLLPLGSGPFLEVLQDQVNPWGSRSKLLHLPPVPKISLIS